MYKTASVKFYLFAITLFILSLIYFPLTVRGERDSDNLPGARVGRVLVVANSNSPLSLELASAYRRARDLPAANQLNLSLSNTITIPPKKFANQLRSPVSRRLRQLGDGVDFIVLMRDVPYRTGKVSTTTALFFQGHDKLRAQHGYFQRREAFDATVAYTGQRLYPGTVISGYAIGDAMELIERSLVRYSDKEEAGTIYLCEGKGPRGIRNRSIGAALKKLREEGMKVKHVRDYNIVGRDDVLALFTGITRLRLGKNTFMPGSIVDNLTSFGGFLLEAKSQTQILDFIAHGACAAYGTVTEPTNDPRRWATLDTLQRYAEGFTVAEAYYQNVLDWKFGCLVGDPLMAPFAEPPAIEFDDIPERVTTGEEVDLTFKLREGRSGEGISWAEIWFDDDYRLDLWEPSIPADTDCRLKVTLDNKTIFEVEHRVEETENYRKVLQHIVKEASEKINLALVGKHRNKILIRLPVKGELKNRQLACSFSFETDDETFERAYDLNVNTLHSTSAILRFGTANPGAGDQIDASVEGEEISLQAIANESIESFIQRFARELFQTEHLGKDGDFVLRLEKQEGEGDDSKIQDYLIRIIPKDPYSNTTVDMDIKVNRQEDSDFAPKLADDDKDIWQLRPLGTIAEAVIQPFVPADEIEKTITIPDSLVKPGKYTLRCTAASPRGAFNSRKAEIEVAAEGESDVPAVELAEEVIDWGDELSFELFPRGIPAKAKARLLIDGKVKKVLDMNSGKQSLSGSKDSLAPGKHHARIEWFIEENVKAAEDDSRLVDQRRFAGRSGNKEFWVRRPLLHQVEWQPKKVNAGEDFSIEVEGPYLDDSAYIKVNGKEYDLERVSRSKARWGVDMTAPADVGEYEIFLFADSEKYKGGKLSGKLKVRSLQP